MTGADSQTKARPIRVLCVDDHPIFQDGMHAMIRDQEDMVVAGCAYQASEAIDLVKSLRPDVILMDLNLPDMSGIAATQLIRCAHPFARVIILTTYGHEEDVRGAIEAGANGYLLKEALQSEMTAAIRAVHKGGRYLPTEIAIRLADSMTREPLTRRESEVLDYISNGLRNGEIARALRITHQTVKTHVRAILAKLGAADRTQAILTAIRRGLVHLK
jgi:two-component system NarL family response regulator